MDKKDTFLGKKIHIEIFDFDGMEKEAQKILEHLKSSKLFGDL